MQDDSASQPTDQLTEQPTEQTTDQSTEQTPVETSTVQYSALPVSSEENWQPLIDSHGEIEIIFSKLGAGIEELILLDEFETVALVENIRLQQRVENSNHFSAVPFSLAWIKIDDQDVDISGSRQNVWTQLSPGVFEATVVDAAGNPVAKVTRRYKMRETAHAFTITQSIENLSSETHTFRFLPTAMVDMPKAKNGYAGDRRRVRYGTLRSPEQQGNSVKVNVDEKLANRSKLLGSKIKDANGNKHYEEGMVVWPTEKTMPSS